MRRVHVTEDLSAYLDEQVTLGERERIEAHLQECAPCRAHLESLRQIAALTRGLDPVPAPAGFQAAVRARLAEKARPRGGLAVPRLLLARPALSWKVIGIAAAAMVVGVFSVNLLRGVPPARMARPQGASQTSGARPAATPEAPALQGSDRFASPRAAAPGTTDFTLPSGGPAMRQVIRTARLALTVKAFDDASRRLVEIAERAGGFVASSSYVQTSVGPEGTFTLRVPAARFAPVLAEVEGLGTVEERRVSGQDVTEEFVDLRARVRNLERHEQQLLAFMDRAVKISDLLAIEQELARVRGEIEALTGRLRLMGSQVDLATVEVSVRQHPADRGGFWDFAATLRRMQRAFLATVRQLLAVAEKLGIAASALVPVIVLVLAVWFGIRTVRMRIV